MSVNIALPFCWPFQGGCISIHLVYDRFHVIQCVVAIHNITDTTITSSKLKEMENLRSITFDKETLIALTSL